ncbi:hypothetical protein CA850_29845 [Micromonospora echinospora]|uniref:Uncharacterized protein n=1 Tax=Micromonospora echinospora TaxID=1877 RepID=A0A1C5AB48_MICEC|nr:hypothetical protein [Micromonospora echinospora]OZV74782.1 hypothetical protein CA850_29845 [Micromonospora echinospora]SCF42244.1 hypothetical protein GA0070618_6632 [Micromonospora echinospora]
MTDPLAELAAVVAERHALDPADFAARVRRQLARRMARGRIPFKVCPACGEALPALSFAEDISKGDGLKVVCRECDAARQAERRSASPSPGA